MKCYFHDSAVALHHCSQKRLLEPPPTEQLGLSVTYCRKECAMGAKPGLFSAAKTHHGRKPEKRDQPGPPLPALPKRWKRFFSFKTIRENIQTTTGFKTVFESSNHQKHTFRIQGWAVLTILHQGKHAMHSGQVLELHGWSMDWFSESNMISILRIQLVSGISWNIMEVGTLFSEANYWIFDANILGIYLEFSCSQRIDFLGKIWWRFPADFRPKTNSGRWKSWRNGNDQLIRIMGTPLIISEYDFRYVIILIMTQKSEVNVIFTKIEKALRLFAGSAPTHQTRGKIKTLKDDLWMIRLSKSCGTTHELTTDYVMLLGTKKSALRDSRPLACHCPKGTLHPSLFPQAQF